MTDLLPRWFPLLGRALLDFVWQGAVIGLVAALVLAVMGNARHMRATPSAASHCWPACWRRCSNVILLLTGHIDTGVRDGSACPSSAWRPTPPRHCPLSSHGLLRFEIRCRWWSPCGRPAPACSCCAMPPAWPGSKDACAHARHADAPAMAAATGCAGDALRPRPRARAAPGRRSRRRPRPAGGDRWCCCRPRCSCACPWNCSKPCSRTNSRISAPRLPGQPACSAPSKHCSSTTPSCGGCRASAPSNASRSPTSSPPKRAVRPRTLAIALSTLSELVSGLPPHALVPLPTSHRPPMEVI